MNDLYYIEYKPELMLSDTIDMDAETELAHRRLCDFIWKLDKPPKADNEFLKQFTKTKPADWGRVKKGLLDKGWAEVGGVLLHKGVINSLNSAKEKYAEKYNQTAPATAKKNGSKPRLMVCQRDKMSGIVTLTVTHSDTPRVTHPETDGQLESKLQSGKSSPPGEGSAGREIPGEEEARAQCMAAGIAEDFLRYIYAQWAMQNGRNANNIAVDWVPYATSRWSREQVEWRAGTHRGKITKHANHHGNPAGRGRPVTDRNAGTLNKSSTYAGITST